MNLLINACVRENSRTLRLAKRAAEAFCSGYTELELYSLGLLPLTEADLSFRDSKSRELDFSSPEFSLAKSFVKAENIIIAAPFWDLSFPSVLKLFIEHICVSNLSFRYTEEGRPEGLCRAKRLVYVTTAGGFISEPDFGFGYIDALCKGLFGITDTVCIKAEGLDIDGADVEGILREAEKRIDTALKKPAE